MKKLLIKLAILFCILKSTDAYASQLNHEELQDSKKAVDLRESMIKDSITPLMEAAMTGDIEKIQNLLIEVHDEPGYYLSHIPINAQDLQGRTALFIAAQENYPEVIELLLNVKDIESDKADNDGITPLAIAVDNENSEAVQALLKNKDNKKCEIETRDTRVNFTPLMRATRSGNEAIIKNLLAAGANPTLTVKKNGVNITPMSLLGENQEEIASFISNKQKEFTKRTLKFIKALKNNDYSKAHNLFTQGIDVNINVKGKGGPLHWAAYVSNVELVKLLIKQMADVNSKAEGKFESTTPLHAALAKEQSNEENRKEIVLQLIKNKADVNAKDESDSLPIHYAARNGSVECIDILLDAKSAINAKNYCYTVLHEAAMNGHKEVLAKLIERNANCNELASNSGSILDVAAQKGHSEVVALLIGLNADINRKDQLHLHLAAEEGSLNTALLLINKKVDVNLPDKNMRTPLHYAVQRDTNIEMVKELIKAKANINAQDENGRNALHTIFTGQQINPKDRKDILSTLIELGADVNAKDQWGGTVMYYARSIGIQKLIELLIKAGATD